MTETEVVKALAALAQETRLRVFRLLVVAGAQGLMPTHIAEQLGVPPTALSFHLKELSHAGLIAAERNGRTLTYRAQFAHMNSLLGYLTEQCCGGQPCGVGAAFNAAPAESHHRAG